MEWISIKDKKPKEDEIVLTFSMLWYTNPELEMFPVAINHFFQLKEKWPGCEQVTHWMPLPKPPKE